MTLRYAPTFEKSEECAYMPRTRISYPVVLASACVVLLYMFSVFKIAEYSFIDIHVRDFTIDMHIRIL